MNVFRRIAAAVRDRRSENVNDPHFWVNTLLDTTGASTRAGVLINDRTALNVSTVWACIKVLGESMASLPLMVYRRRPDGGKEPATDHPLFRILHDRPNDVQTSYELRECLMAHLNLRGNAYCYKELAANGTINRLIPLNPARMNPKLTADGIVYEYSPRTGGVYRWPAAFVWHLKGMTTAGLVATLDDEGITGLSPITIARNSIGMTQAVEDYGADVFARQATPGAILKHPQTLKPQARDYLKQSLDAYASSKRRMSLVLEEGMEWVQVGMNNDDSQFLETRVFQVKEIARWFGVPLVLLQEPEKFPYASAEQFFLSFVVHTLRPWCTRWEQSMNASLLNDNSGTYFTEHKLDGLLRGDIASRYAAYAVGRQWGWLSANDIRGLENMNPIPDGNRYLEPLNMGTPGEKPEPETKGGANENKE